ncbi:MULTISPECIES: acyl-CoA thioesterase [Corallincola]|uniref:Acyl-CoA thioesterase n=2 Tax=Corallincola TaxID=1775176 RepID=A0ABY1WTE8_9GAMM|nr:MULTISPECIES: thioesterase family protein [Corallincola]TAA48015.1 acyl-CoA thioesterase [Corallincola spongiicola]TCI03331.1 acyl-CoA thioesterase [Corallincola luteus]
MNNLLNDFPVVIEQAVAWGEMDALNHVNNSVYFKYFENARIAYFGKIKVMQQMQTLALAPVLASTQCRYKMPLTYPDSISIGARISELNNDRFMMEYRVVSHKNQRTAAEGSALVVAYNTKAQRKDNLPSSVVEVIRSVERINLVDNTLL